MSLESGFEVRVSDSVTLGTAVAGFRVRARSHRKDVTVSPFRRRSSDKTNAHATLR